MEFKRIIRLAKEGIWILLGQISIVAGSLVLVRVLTQYLDPDQYGYLALGLTIASFVNQVVMGGITNSIGRFFSIAAGRGELKLFFESCYHLMTYASILVVIIITVLALVRIIAPISQWIDLANIALIFATISGWNAGCNAIQNAARHRPIVAFHGGLEVWLKILFSVLLIYMFEPSSVLIMVGFIFSAILVTCSQFVFLNRIGISEHPTDATSPNWGFRMWSYAWPFSIWGIFTWAQQISDKWALQAFGSLEEVGLYAVIFQLGYTPISLVMQMVMAFLGPILFQRSGSATDEKSNRAVHLIAWRITLLGLSFTAIATILTFTLHEKIFELFVAKKFHEVSYLLPWMIFSGGIFSAGQILSLKILAQIKPKALIGVKVFSAIVGLLANIVGAVLFGLEGVVTSMIIVSSVYFLLMIFLSRKSSEINNSDCWLSLKVNIF
ncbi:MAG: lipopolysaccharide biosynthesis protein [Desulfobulbaceae bacterium]|nr:MAG: lipopolysaccharide biosynthesis protein [Desulfobulbaceae bacterium]